MHGLIKDLEVLSQNVVNLIEDYERRINTINLELKSLRRTEENIDTHKRLNIKLGCYRTFLSELKKV